MPQFSYRARNPQGDLVEGVLDCADRAVAIRQIELQHCVPIRIEINEAGAGIEPANSGFADRDLTTWLPRRSARTHYRV